MFSGVFELPWWGYAAAALALTHVTIFAVTVFLHRHQTHRALELPSLGRLRVEELVALWGRSMATHEQLVRRLQDWCQRAEASGIAPLAEFSWRLRSYA